MINEIQKIQVLNVSALQPQTLKPPPAQRAQYCPDGLLQTRHLDSRVSVTFESKFMILGVCSRPKTEKPNVREEEQEQSEAKLTLLNHPYLHLFFICPPVSETNVFRTLYKAPMHSLSTQRGPHTLKLRSSPLHTSCHSTRLELCFHQAVRCGSVRISTVWFRSDRFSLVLFVFPQPSMSPLGRRRVS